jgi:hypothetical protein
MPSCLLSLYKVIKAFYFKLNLSQLVSQILANFTLGYTTNLSSCLYE